MDETIFKVFLARLEESAFYYGIHKNDVWKDQLEKTRQKLLTTFLEQQKEIERLEKYYENAVIIGADYEVKPKGYFCLNCGRTYVTEREVSVCCRDA